MRQIMSKHSEQHRTLINLLRCGTISHDERLPEDDTFDYQAEAEAYGVGDFNANTGTGVEPVYAARETHKRAPASNDLLPLVLQNFESSLAGFSRLSVPPKNVVINVSRDVEIDRDEGDNGAWPHA
ncbi:hypothetical protein QFC21_005248 [Naganishia friedmannii]|uniref:Uncharacterized protein n=1 Tax=Naganishia friedmannii TaxID=89922 RepID=A0ACC2VBH5_9TREE|nr:hypothetical protein QFC21_005248 [Naganishia friedmannii]